MSAQQELIERLRHHASSAPVISRQSIDMDAAADRLASLEADRCEISMALGNQPDELVSAAEMVENIEHISRIAGKGALRISALEAENAALKAKLEGVDGLVSALGPFERFGGMLAARPDFHPQDTLITMTSNSAAATLAVRDFFEARAAIAAYLAEVGGGE